MCRELNVSLPVGPVRVGLLYPLFWHLLLPVATYDNDVDVGACDLGNVRFLFFNLLLLLGVFIFSYIEFKLF